MSLFFYCTDMNPLCGLLITLIYELFCIVFYTCVNPKQNIVHSWLKIGKGCKKNISTREVTEIN